jgi:hypothetical protein
MASVKRRLAANALGDFYVGSTCIDCGTCCWSAVSPADRLATQRGAEPQDDGDPSLADQVPHLAKQPMQGFRQRRVDPPVITSNGSPERSLIQYSVLAGMPRWRRAT